MAGPILVYKSMGEVEQKLWILLILRPVRGIRTLYGPKHENHNSNVIFKYLIYTWTSSSQTISMIVSSEPFFKMRNSSSTPEFRVGLSWPNIENSLYLTKYSLLFGHQLSNQTVVIIIMRNEFDLYQSCWIYYDPWVQGLSPRMELTRASSSAKWGIPTQCRQSVNVSVFNEVVALTFDLKINRVFLLITSYMWSMKSSKCSGQYRGN